MKEKEIKQLVNEGWIHSTAIIEIGGRPKEHVEETLKGVVAKIKEEGTIKIINENYADAEEKEKVFFAFAELEILFKDVETMTGFCFDYMPSSIEIIGPEKISISAENTSNFLNDICTRLHKSDAIVKNIRFENELVQANLSATLQNLIIMSLRFKDKTLDEMSKDCGLRPEHLEPVLRILMKQKIIEFDGKTARLGTTYRREIQEKTENENKN